jgi:hypothetical protein
VLSPDVPDQATYEQKETLYMSLKKNPKFENEKQEVRTDIEHIGAEDSADDVVMFRVKTALRAGPRVEC